MTEHTRWTLLRQDDNGSSAIIDRGLEKSAADSKLKELEARGHKQLYWMEREQSSSSPRLNLIVIRSKDIDVAKSFYEQLGLTFERHKHGKGAEHYACELPSFVFEIYPVADCSSSGARIGISVSDVDSLVSALKEKDCRILAEPKDSPWGRRAVVQDPDDHSVEIISPILAEQVAEPDL